MSQTVLTALGAIAVLGFGAELLVRGAGTLAMRLGVSALAVGLTVVAFGTSAPEFVVSVRAAALGSTDLAVGNVVGSNVANIGLILGLGALIRPVAVHATVFRLDAPLLALLTVAVSILLVGPGIGRPAGAALTAALAAYSWATLKRTAIEPMRVREEFAEGVTTAQLSLIGSVVMTVIGLALLVVGAELLVGAAVRIAQVLGVGEAVVGLTVVAIGTSLPELATTIVAAARGQGDIMVGNIVGSNFFNLAGTLGVAAIVRPLSGRMLGGQDVGVMLVFAVVLVVASRSGAVISRAEGVLLIAGYLGYVVWLFVGGGVI